MPWRFANAIISSMKTFAFAILYLISAAPARAALSADAFQVFSLGSIYLSQGDFEGRTGAVDNAHFDNFSIGDKQRTGGATLMVGGSATLIDGSVLNGRSRTGDVRAGGRIYNRGVGTYNHFFEHSNVAAQLSGVPNELLRDSRFLAALSPNAGEYRYWDAGRGLNILVLAANPSTPRTVIDLAADSLADARTVSLRVPEGAVLVVNVIVDVLYAVIDPRIKLA